MMRILTNIKTLKSIINPIAATTDECRANISPSGMKIKCADAAQVVLVDADLRKEMFFEYQADEIIQVGLNIQAIQSAIEITEGNESVEIIFNFEGSGKMYLTIAGIFVFTIDLLNPFDIRKELTVPTLKPKASVELSTIFLKRVVELSYEVAEYIIFQANNETSTIDIKSWDNKVSKFKVTISTAIELQPTERVILKSVFSLDYLSDVVKSITADKVKLLFDDERPVIIKFKIAEHGNIFFMIAPRADKK